MVTQTQTAEEKRQSLLASHGTGTSPTPDSTTRPTRRKIRRASVACVACRDRKSKCDGDSGQRNDPCSHCKQLGKACVFRFDDQRKKPPARIHIQRLQERIALLEQNQRGSPPEMSEEDSPPSFALNPLPVPSHDTFHIAEGDEFSIFLRDSSEPSYQDIFPLMGDVSELEPVNSQFNYNMADIPKTPTREKSFAMPPSVRRMSDDFISRQSIEAKNVTESADMESLDEGMSWSMDSKRAMIDRLCSTMGCLSMDENGQPRYFGSTSNLHITPYVQSPPSPSAPTDFDAESLSKTRPLHDYLIRLYFLYHHPALPLLHKESFLQDYAKGVRTPYFSPFLLNAVLLRSARLSENPQVQALHSIYLANMRAEIQSELDDSTLATVQALCILGDYLGSQGNDRGGWLYPGIAFRLLYDFGLNRDCADLMAMGHLSERDQQIRHTTLWGCFVFDKLYSAYQGRPSNVKASDISIPRPSLETIGHEFQPLKAWTDLCSIISDITDIVNGPLHLLENQNINSRLSRTGERLLQWFKELPAELQWRSKNELPSPGVAVLHMQFYTAIILLHRPFAAYSTRRIAIKPLIGYTPTISRRICCENAVRIAKLLLAYRQRHGIEKTFTSMLHMIFVSATTLIAHISTIRADEGDDEEERKYLQVCLEALRDLSPALPTASRAHLVLVTILQRCGYPELARLDGDDVDQDPQLYTLNSKNKPATTSKSTSDFPLTSLLGGDHSVVPPVPPFMVAPTQGVSGHFDPVKLYNGSVYQPFSWDIDTRFDLGSLIP